MTGVTYGLAIDATLFATLVEELKRRGGGVRESGAFMLASASLDPLAAGDAWHSVTALAFYDDLDPACLTGGITFSANGYTALGVVCRRDGVRVVGDIHTHPRRWADQSPIDAAHPMVAIPGHIALIVPKFALGAVRPSDLGAHVFGGTMRWTSHFGDDVASVLRVTETRPVPVRRRSLRELGRCIRRLLTSWGSR